MKGRQSKNAHNIAKYLPIMYFGAIVPTYFYWYDCDKT